MITLPRRLLRLPNHPPNVCCYSIEHSRPIGQHSPTRRDVQKAQSSFMLCLNRRTNPGTTVQQAGRTGMISFDARLASVQRLLLRKGGGQPWFSGYLRLNLLEAWNGTDSHQRSHRPGPGDCWHPKANCHGCPQVAPVIVGHPIFAYRNTHLIHTYANMLSLKPRPFVQSSFDIQAPRYPHVFFFFFFFLLFIWRCCFFRLFSVPLPFSF